jgi:Antitoxin of toxin-antitoxin, RelE / RelB, TA system
VFAGADPLRRSGIAFPGFGLLVWVALVSIVLRARAQGPRPDTYLLYMLYRLLYLWHNSAMHQPLTVSRAREELSDVFSDAVRRHLPVLIERRDERAVLVGLEELDVLLAAHAFHPEVFFEEAAVTVWLPEFAIYGRGPTYDDAQKDLLEEVREYVGDYLADSAAYLNAPNRRRQFPHVVRAFVSDKRGRLSEVLFAPPADVAAPAAVEERAAATV